jgi:DNA recombination protein RmuC
MNDNFILLLSIFIAAGIGAYIGMVISKLKAKSEKSALEERESQLLSSNTELKEHVSQLEEQRNTFRDERDGLNIELAQKDVEFENLQRRNEEKDKELIEQQEQLRKDFELLANKILEEKSNKFSRQNKEQLSLILNPLQEKIRTFEDKVEKSQKESISMHSALKEQLLGLKDLNEQMSKEATNLTKALKGDSKMQGNWGELVLERVLEKSGLEKDREYFVQQSFTLEDGSRLLPDVVLHLPDNKKMIIDSKVSLTHYERFINADNEERSTLLKSHVQSIKKHIDQLSEKNYQDLYDIESPDFVLMFIPIEPAFAVALNEDNSLYNKAFEKNIVVVTPATLLATLRTIDSMWNNEKQQRNALEIARQAGALYDKFEGLVKDLTGVGKDIDRAKSNYSLAMNKLVEGRGNLITSVEKLKKMGAKAKKSLPENIVKRAEENLD